MVFITLFCSVLNVGWMFRWKNRNVSLGLVFYTVRFYLQYKTTFEFTGTITSILLASKDSVHPTISIQDSVDSNAFHLHLGDPVVFPGCLARLRSAFIQGSLPVFKSPPEKTIWEVNLSNAKTTSTDFFRCKRTANGRQN